MNLLENVPIKRKLITISVLTSAIVVFLACAAFLTYEQFTFRSGMERDLAVSAQMIGLNSAAALAFDDPISAEQTLNALKVHPYVLAARIYEPDGTVFASYQSDSEIKPRWPKVIEPGSHFARGRLQMLHEIEFLGDKIGMIFLESDLQPMYARVKRYAEIALVVLILSVAFAFLIAARLQGVISQPVLELAQMASRVAGEKDYSLRAVKRGEDELGRLVDRFNGMLEQIQQRDFNLREAQTQLEKRVEERTSALKRAREEAEREKAIFQFIFDSVPVGISWRVSGPDDVPLVNAAYRGMTGFADADEKKKHGFERFAHPEDLVKQNHLSRKMEAGAITQYSLEKRYLLPEGQTVWAVYSSHLFPDPQRSSKQIVTTLVDVTELKLAHEEAMREHARFKFIFESVPVGISWVIHGESSTFVSNPAHVQITGLSSEEAAKPGSLESITHPDDQKKQKTLNQQLESGMIDRYTMEKRYLFEDGRQLWINFTRRVFHEPFTGLRQDVSTLVDITERKRTTDELDRIFRLSQDIICTVGFDGYFKRINPAFERILGYSTEELLAHPITHFVEVADVDELAVERNRLAESELTTFFENRYRCKDGSIKWMQWKAVSVKEEQLFYCVVRDVTKQKEDETELEEMHAQLIETSHQAGMAEVATAVLHNVGNVLNSINVSATVIADKIIANKAAGISRVCQLLEKHSTDLGEFLSSDPQGQQLTAYLKTLSDHIERENAEIQDELIHLNKNLEHMKDIVAMQQTYAKRTGFAETLPAVELVEDAIRMNAGALIRHDIEIARDYKDRPIVRVEKHKILQILVNLISNAKNACDASGKPQRKITAQIRVEDDYVNISIIDNGVGILPEHLNQVFSHGFTTRRDGHGFGLHSGALVARELNGSLEVFSEGLGEGATFLLRFPMQAKSEEV